MEETITSPQPKTLPSYKFYQKLINGENLNDVKNLCRGVLNRYPNGEWLYGLCKQLIKNVELVRDDNDDTFRKKHCFDINYWLYDEVYNGLKSIDKESDF
ncbi:Kir-like protein [Plasmodium coatneyi]|uniref:Kir-like protein n=1 Tax=Plasmodium coatneyi TaxID=208452 RepID=A0A1B1DX44_9APIC|nr:Kir-like protein [Plasmodium coatneyi]ANQ07177.1 Kir-like protein [Plasmodium coatneyi]